ncbi:MAG: hypothetical protein FWG18_03225 [Alphaproteobacteria bacterium]|nr:hypothetical protein [Alphaproteobacteria bacterium]
MKRFFLGILCLFTAHAAHAAQVVNVDYVHRLIKQVHGIDVPTPATNIYQAVNVKYVLCAVDAANGILNGMRTSYCNHTLATTRVMDTTATIEAVNNLIRFITSALSAPSTVNPNFHSQNPVSWTGPDGTYIASTSYQHQPGAGYGPGIVFADFGFSSGPRDGWPIPCGTAGWLRLQMPVQKAVVRFRFYTRANANPNSGEAPAPFTITASNDGANWTTIYDSPGPPPGWKSGNMQASDWMYIPSPAPFLFYQLNVTKCYGLPTSTGYTGIGKWEMEI